MTLTRLTAWALLTVSAFTLTQNGAASQSNPTREPPVRTAFEAGLFDLEQFQGFPILQKEVAFPSKNSAAFTAVKTAQEGGRIDPGSLESIKGHMKTFAEYYAGVVSHPLVYKIIQDPSKMPKFEDPDNYKIDKKIEELGRYLLEPHPSNRTGFGGGLRVTEEKMDYIRELGAALDTALIKVVNEHPERIVQINAMRVYASVCKTGAPAHWPTVTNLLKNQNTRTEIKHYALQAAANLLWAYDPNDYKSRRHSIGSKEPRPETDKEIGALVKAVEDCVTNPKMLVPDFPQGKDAKDVKPTQDQIEVVQYVRRQAIRALGEVRFVTLPGPEGKDAEGKVKWIYPAQTLVRVCMSDPTLFPSPTPSECAEAVIGLSNMAPVWDGAPVKGFNADAVAEAVATGIITFATPRSASATDRTLPWIRYSLRMSEALKGWAPLFDFLYDPVKPNPANANAAPPVIADIVGRAERSVLAPMKAAAGQVNVGVVAEFLKARQADPKRTGILFTGVPQTALPGVEVKPK